MRQAQQEISTKAERVPEELNSIGKLIRIDEYLTKYDDLVLLFRGIGFGDGLVTEGMARDYLRTLEGLAKRDSEKLSRMFRSLPQYPQEDYIVVVTPIKGYSNYSA